MTQKERVIARILEVGYVDNFWAIDNFMLRLGAIIYDLQKENWEFAERKFGEHSHRKNYYYYVSKTPKGITKPNFGEEPIKIIGRGEGIVVYQVAGSKERYYQVEITHGAFASCQCEAYRFSRDKKCKHCDQVLKFLKDQAAKEAEKKQQKLL